jgi:hypothetical protein
MAPTTVNNLVYSALSLAHANRTTSRRETKSFVVTYAGDSQEGVNKPVMLLLAAPTQSALPRHAANVTIPPLTTSGPGEDQNVYLT